MVETDPTSADLNGTVVVGIDGSDASQHALRWTVDKSDEFGKIVPVTTFQLPATFDVLTRARSGADPSVHRTAAEARLARAIEATDPTLRDRAKVIEAHPGVGLTQAAADADLLVLGTRGRRSVTMALLGSVSSYCVKHSPVPVIVVPPEFPADRPLVNAVVGVDGSANAVAALEWTIRHLEPNGTIYAVGALSAWGYGGEDVDPSPELMVKNLQDTVEAAVAQVAPLAVGGPEIDIACVAKDARVALRELAGSDADLLVVGARGVAGVPYLILGSVSMALVHHPLVPTVVIPATHDLTAGPEPRSPQDEKG